MVLTTYGRSSGFCIDPIEKKPLNHFYPGSTVLSFGTAGCNLACKFCQNWDISKSREMDTLMDPASPAAIAAAAHASGCRSVAFTYNDPVIFAEYAMDAADACHERGIQTVAVTAGYICVEPRREFYAKMDAANVDLKGFTEEFYVKLTGARLRAGAGHARLPRARDRRVDRDHDAAHPRQERLGRGARGDVRVDRARARPRRAAALHGVPSRLQDDRPAAHARRDADARPRASRSAPGLRYVYTGNVHDREGGTTFCPACAKPLIVRDWHDIVRYQVTDDGCCRHCGAALPGRFARYDGAWGRRRIPVRVAAVGLLVA